jgi:putative serine protease PepD
MNENETDPRSADASLASSSPERGTSEQPTVAQPSVATPAAAAPPAPQPGPAESASYPASSYPASPWQQPAATDQRPTVPVPPQAQHPGYQQQPYAPYPGYQQPQYAPQPAYAGAWQGTPAGSGPPATDGQPTEGQPAWAYPVDGGQQPPRSGRGRKIFVAGAAAVLLALGAGGAGAAAALAFDDDSSTPTVQQANSAVTKVVDRSSLAEIASAMRDRVVSITTQSGEGSGVVLSADGYIVTNNHVVATAQGNSVTVIFADGKKAPATIVGTDQRSDLAVVKATGVANLKAAKFGSSANMQVGDTVLAIGSPLGLEGSVTAGIISAKDRTIQSSSEGEGQQNPLDGSSQQQQSGATNSMSGLLQTDAPINPGNSGGALVNTSGDVIGINSAIATQGQGSGNIGLGFAIPSDKASKVANDLMAGKKISHPALGVSVAEAENGGALVSNVLANSAAAKAGLQQGDVITTVDGKTIGSANDLIAAVQAGTVGQKMTIDFTRDGAKKTVVVTLAEAQ